MQRDLKAFDVLNFVAFRKADWSIFHDSDHYNVVVTYPGYRQTRSISDHLVALRWFFIFAPDSKIISHSIRITTKDWTALEGVIKGTFMRLIHLRDGRTVQPNGKR